MSLSSTFIIIISISIIIFSFRLLYHICKRSGIKKIYWLNNACLTMSDYKSVARLQSRSSTLFEGSPKKKTSMRILVMQLLLSYSLGKIIFVYWEYVGEDTAEVSPNICVVAGGISRNVRIWASFFDLYTSNLTCVDWCICLMRMD